jgi:hypothetical protein
MRISARHLPLLSALCLAACSGGDSAPATKMATESQVTDPVLGNRIKSGDNGDDDYGRMADKFGDWNTAMTAEGQSTGKGGKEFAGFKRDNKEFKGKWDNKEFKAGDYRKKSWWGDKDYATKVYDGKTDGSRFQKDSHIGEKSANEGAMAAREGSESYGTKDYKTARAREEGGNKIGKASDAETDERRRVFTQPDVIPWQQQNLTVEDTRRMLGKDR